MMPQLICLVRKHQWHNGWDEDRHRTVWTCNRCGKRRSDENLRQTSGPGGGRRGMRRTTAA